MATPLARMFPPGDGRHQTIKANGRPYTMSPGGFVDVPDHDARVLQANGWTRAGGAGCFVGPTSARPAPSAGVPLQPGQVYIDTTLGAVINWDPPGGWRNVMTGAVV